MDTEALYRRYGGSVYITRLPDGLVVPWKPLSVEKYIEYTFRQLNGLIATAELENRVFIECVQDKTIIQQIDYLKAGTVSVVARNIWEHSGPETVETFQLDMSNAREFVSSPVANSIHELVKLITMAYPYKPEEIYDMDYKTLMIRVAMAEAKLLALGVIASPINIGNVEEKKAAPKRKRETLDAKKLWEIQEGLEQRDKQAKIDQAKIDIVKEGNIAKRKTPWKVSPVLEQPATHRINFREARALDEIGMAGGDRMDLPESRAKMVEDAQVIYADLIAKLQQKNKGG